jgi:pilus assembly protein CpaE
MRKLKIAIVSPSLKHLRETCGVLEGDGHQVSCIEGGKSHLRSVAEREQPDLLIADGLCCDLDELAQAEYVTTHHPRTAVVLMCSAHSPEYLLNAMRAGVREVLPSPVGAEALRATVQRISNKLGGPTEPAHAGKVVAFVPCKGGSGATFLATNIAWLLAAENKVLLVDLNLQFGDALSFLHDGRPGTTVADVAANIDRLDASLLSASTVKVTPSLHVLAAPDDPGQALEVQPEHVETILAQASRQFDFVVVDLGRHLDTASIKVLDRASRVFAVLQPTLPAIRHASKMRQVFLTLGYAPQKMHFVVNGCGGSAEFGIEHVQRSLAGASVTALGEAAREVTASINRGEPLVDGARSSPLGRQLVELARMVDPQREEQKGLLGRIFRRA